MSTRDHYKGVPHQRYVAIDRNNNLIVPRSILGNLPIPIEAASERVHDVVNFGAIGDGVVDDTAAIQAAIDAACASSLAGFGGIVYFPPLLYKVTSTLVVNRSYVRIMGCHLRAARIQFYNTAADTLFLFEDTDPGALIYCGICHLTLKAANDTLYTKIAVDAHAVRKFHMHDVQILAWNDVNHSSIGLRVRGWDDNVFERLALTADIPLVIAKNDNGSGGYLDDTKDIDHTRFLNCEFVAVNPDKIGVKIDSGAVFRNLTFRGIAFVQGGISCVDTEVPRRRSTNLLVADARFEGFAETDGDVFGKYAIDIQRHINGQLRNLTVENVLLAEGADPRYGTEIAANWNGIRAVGVWRTSLIESTYSGGQTPVTYSGGVAPEYFNGQWTEQDYGKAIPECEAQWDQLGIARPRSWWKFAIASGNCGDQQDAILTGLVDRQLNAVGSPSYQQFSDGWHGYQCGFNETADQRFGLASTLTDFSPQDRSAAWLAYYNFAKGWTPGGKRLLISLGDPQQTGSNGPNVYINSQGRLETYAGSTVVTGTVNYLGHDCAFLPVYNRTAGTWKVYTATVASGIMETITGTYSSSVGNTNPKGFGGMSGSYTSCSGSIRFGAMWFNGGAEGLDETTLTKLGW